MTKNFYTNKLDTRNSRRDDDDEDVMFQDKHLGYSERTKSISVIRVYLDEPIAGPKYYRGVVDRVVQAEEGDQVIYNISSIGGRMDGMISLIEANRQSDADILAVITGECHSAASMFALSCDNIAVSPSATMMVHYVTFGAGGKASDVKATVEHNLEFCENYFREIYEGFLTDEEMKLCIDTGKEIWMQSDEIIDRLEKRQEYLKNKYEDEPYVNQFDVNPDEISDEVIPRKKTKSK